MKNPVKTFLLLLASVALFLGADIPPKLNYPVAPKGNQVDDYHGVKIADPYRSLENADAPSTEKFVQQENELTFSYLAKLPGREAIKKQLTELWNYEKFGGFHKAGNHYFYFHNSGLQNQSVVYVMDSLNGPARVLLDPNTFARMGRRRWTAKRQAGMGNCGPMRWRRRVRIGPSGGCATWRRGKICRI